jgi:hypothetical protein
MRTFESMYKEATSMKFVLHIIRAFHNDDKVEQITVTEPTKCSLTNKVFEAGTLMYKGFNSNVILSTASLMQLDDFIEDNKEDKRIAWLLNDLEQPKDIKMAS